MNSFLRGNYAVKVFSADDMAKFVDWLNKHNQFDLLVANQNYRKEYAKISFWKNIAKQELSNKHKWIHPAYLCIYFGVWGDRLYWNYEYKEVANDFGRIVEAKDL